MDPRIYAAVGFHPHDASSWTKDSLVEIRELAKDEKVVAIGEIGLDYFRDRSPRVQQRKVFEELLNLALELCLPVVIHNREALSDLLPLVTSWIEQWNKSVQLPQKSPGVMHAFSEKIVIAEKMVHLGFFLGISGAVTYGHGTDLQNLVRTISLDKLLLETDAPYLTPVPYRGKRNEPSYLPLVAEMIADQKKIPIKICAEATSNNAEHLFGWRE